MFRPASFGALVAVVAAMAWHAAARLGDSRQPYVVKLWKEHVRDDSGEAHPDRGGGYFIGAIQIGGLTPQELHVAFTTSVGMVTLPGSKCSGAACTEHHRYMPAQSDTSVDVQLNGNRVDSAGGGRRAPEGAHRDTTKLDFMASNADENGGINGEFVADDICLGDRVGNKGTPKPLCANMRLVVATHESEATFKSRPQDGMVGLAPNGGLSLNEHFNFLSSLPLTDLQPRFGFYVADDAGSAELMLGGHDSSKLESNKIQWVPITKPEAGHWLVSIRSVRIAGKKLDICAPPDFCRGVIHTSSPKIIVHDGMSEAVLEPLKEFANPGSSGCRLPKLSFELESGISLDLTAEDYAGPECVPEIIKHHMMDPDIGGKILWVLGEPLLRRYYTIFDWKTKQVGFSRAQVERSCRRLSRAGLPTDPSSCKGYEEL